MIFAQDPKRLVQYRFECYDRHRIMLAVHLCWSGIMCTVWTFVCMRSNVSNIVDCALLGLDGPVSSFHCRGWLCSTVQVGSTVPGWPNNTKLAPSLNLPTVQAVLQPALPYLCHPFLLPSPFQTTLWFTPILHLVFFFTWPSIYMPTRVTTLFIRVMFGFWSIFTQPISIKTVFTIVLCMRHGHE